MIEFIVAFVCFGLYFLSANSLGAASYSENKNEILFDVMVLWAIYKSISVRYKGLYFIEIFIFILLLYLCCKTDIHKSIIPNKVLGLIICNRVLYLVLEIIRGKVFVGYRIVSNIESFILVCIILYMSYYFSKKFYSKSIVGAGDIKLIGACSIYFKPQSALIMILMACFMGAAVGYIKKKRNIADSFAFGPMVFVACWLLLI